MGIINSICAPSIRTYKGFSKRGFTLIELLVALVIFAILAFIVITIFNPFAQLNKGKNAHRQRDLDQIRTALDTYYNDHECYPTSLTFGTKWSSGSTVYMQKVPQDVNCNKTDGLCYLYQTDNSSCPQWNILYATMQAPVVETIATCNLPSQTNCTPQGYGASGVNYCLISGKLDCSAVSSGAMPTGQYAPPSNPTPTSGSQQGQPTPTGVYPTCSPKNWDCRAGTCNKVPDGTGNYCTTTCDCACNASCN